MGTTALGLVYPDGDDPIAIPADMEELADSADTAIQEVRDLFIRKSKIADEVVTNSTTYQNDDDLFFPIGSNERWGFDFTCIYSATESQDMKICLTFPTGSTCPWGLIGLRDTATPTSHNGWYPAFDNPSSGAGFTIGGTGASNSLLMKVSGTIITSGTSGTLQLQFAQNAAAASTVARMRAGSNLFAWRIA